jgi:hypothetical protein
MMRRTALAAAKSLSCSCAIACVLLCAAAAWGQEERRGEARSTGQTATAGVALVRTEGTLAVPLVASAPKIDGKLDDEAWKHAQPLRLWSHAGRPALSESVGYVCRDAENFYFAVECQDDDVAGLVKDAKSPVLYRNDCVELFIVPDREAAYYAHLMLSCDGQSLARLMVKDKWNEPTVQYPLPKMPAAVSVGAKGWTVEASLPIKAFGRTITDGNVWAMGFNREKHSSPAEVTEFLGGFNTPERYPPTYFDGRTIVTDGVGVRNIGDAPADVTVVLSGGDKKDTQALKVAPLETKSIDWQKALGNPAAGTQFEVSILVGGKELEREKYTVAAAGVRPAPGAPASPAPAGRGARRGRAADANAAAASNPAPAGTASNPAAAPNPAPAAAAPAASPAPANPAPAAAADAEPLPPLKLRADSPLRDANFFPISVWAQQAQYAPQYHDSGINVFVSASGWGEAASAKFKELGMYAVMGYRTVGRGDPNVLFKDDPQVMAWMHGDEPDNGSPDATRSIQDFRAWRKGDPTRPIYVNLGQGVANERFGVLTPDNYRAYCKAADIISFDVYPVTNIGADKEGHNRLAITAKGVSRLIDWTDGEKPVWIILETTHINNRQEKPTGAEVKTQVWMSLIAGAKGIGYFCHDFTLPANTSVGLMMDKDMMKAVKDIDRQVLEVAPALNAPTVKEGVASKSSLDSRVDVMVKKAEGATFVFAVNMFNKPEKPTISAPGLADGKADVLGEARQVDVKGGQIVDAFEPYAVHLYKVAGK